MPLDSHKGNGLRVIIWNFVSTMPPMPAMNCIVAVSIDHNHLIKWPSASWKMTIFYSFKVLSGIVFRTKALYILSNSKLQFTYDNRNLSKPQEIWVTTTTTMTTNIRDCACIIFILGNKKRTCFKIEMFEMQRPVSVFFFHLLLLNEMQEEMIQTDTN